jgi:hypothetical protein
MVSSRFDYFDELSAQAGSELIGTLAAKPEQMPSA